MTTKYTQPLNVKFVDNERLEAVRRNVDTRITELQKQTSAQDTASGRWLGKTRLNGSGSGQLSPQTNTLHAWIVGAGGGGGGAAGAGSGTGSGAGGGTGEVQEIVVPVQPGATISWSCGTGGAGGTSGGTNGSTGGSTTLTIGGVTYTATGGTGGNGMAAQANATAFGGVGQGATPSNATVLAHGSARGEDGITDNSIGFSGQGADLPPYGTGGIQGRTSAGGNATGNGAGGGGGNATTVGFAGGSGSDGVIYKVEYT